MDKELKALCRQVSEIIRKEYNFRTRITIDGNYGIEVAYTDKATLLNENEEAERKFNGEVVLL